jgi:YesN/AraC family two-component response regulator
LKCYKSERVIRHLFYKSMILLYTQTQIKYVIFKNQTGENFIEYLTKILKAKFLLKDARYKNYEVGDMVGY